MVGSSMFTLHNPKLSASRLHSQVVNTNSEANEQRDQTLNVLLFGYPWFVQSLHASSWHKPMIFDAYEASIVHGFWSTPWCQRWAGNSNMAEWKLRAALLSTAGEWQ